jgi:hypothetical protein
MICISIWTVIGWLCLAVWGGALSAVVAWALFGRGRHD